MAKPRRNVKFVHRSQMTSSTDLSPRRDSMSSGVSNEDTAALLNGYGANGSPTKVPTHVAMCQRRADADAAQEEPPQQQPQQTEYEKKKQTFITRTIWTFAMIAAFFGAMAAGHLYIIAIVTAVQILTFKEVIAIANVPSREKKLQFTKR